MAPSEELSALQFPQEHYKALRALPVAHCLSGEACLSVRLWDARGDAQPCKLLRSCNLCLLLRQQQLEPECIGAIQIVPAPAVRIYSKSLLTSLPSSGTTCTIGPNYLPALSKA